MKIVIILVFICLNINANEFIDEYYKCTLIEEKLQPITKRRAETLRESELSLVIKETQLIFDMNRHNYLRTGISEGETVDVYGDNWSKGYHELFLNKSQLNFYDISESTRSNKLKIYSCKEASFFEKAMMIKDLF